MSKKVITETYLKRKQVIQNLKTLNILTKKDSIPPTRLIDSASRNL